MSSRAMDLNYLSLVLKSFANQLAAQLNVDLVAKHRNSASHLNKDIKVFLGGKSCEESLRDLLIFACIRRGSFGRRRRLQIWRVKFRC